MWARQQSLCCLLRGKHGGNTTKEATTRDTSWAILLSELPSADFPLIPSADAASSRSVLIGRVQNLRL